MKKTSKYFIGGVVICLAGAICFSTKAIFVKLAYRDTDIDAVSLLALRMIFSLPFFLISAFAYSSRSNNVRFTARDWFVVAVTGCLGYYASSLLDFLGLKLISAGIERLILFIYPTLVLMISSLVMKVKINRIQWWAVAITYGGLLFAFLGEAGLQIQSPAKFYKGSLLIFACAFTYAAYIVSSGQLIPRLGAGKFNSFAMSFAAVGVLIHFLIISNRSLFHLSWSVYEYALAMAIISTVVPSYLVAEGIRRIGSDNTAIVSSVGPVSTILQAHWLLFESVSFLEIAGTVLIIVGVLMVSRQKVSSEEIAVLK